MGFVMGCVIFSVLGLIVFALIPSFRLSLANLAIFVIGAFLATMMSVIAYGRFFGDRNNELTSKWTVLGLFAVMFIGAVLGGSVLVWLIAGLRRQPTNDPDSMA